MLQHAPLLLQHLLATIFYCVCCLAAKTVNYCNCLPSYNYTAANGQTYNVTNGSCIRTSNSELPWCFVVEDTCITPVLHREGLGRNDSGWDTCLNTGGLLPPVIPCTPVREFDKWDALLGVVVSVSKIRICSATFRA